MSQFLRFPANRDLTLGTSTQVTVTFLSGSSKWRPNAVITESDTHTSPGDIGRILLKKHTAWRHDIRQSLTLFGNKLADPNKTNAICGRRLQLCTHTPHELEQRIHENSARSPCDASTHSGHTHQRSMGTSAPLSHEVHETRNPEGQPCPQILAGALFAHAANSSQMMHSAHGISREQPQIGTYAAWFYQFQFRARPAWLQQ
jgi:hypothetical protein